MSYAYWEKTANTLSLPLPNGANEIDVLLGASLAELLVIYSRACVCNSSQVG